MIIVAKTYKMAETIRGMELSVTIKYPENAKIEPLVERFAESFAFARKDPDQLGLFDEKGAGAQEEDDN